MYSILASLAVAAETGPIEPPQHLIFDQFIKDLAIGNFEVIIQGILPVVAIAVLVGFLFYVVRWGISLFRGI